MPKATTEVTLSLVLDEHAGAAEQADAAQMLLTELREVGPDFNVVPVYLHDPLAKDAGQVINAGQIVLALLASGGVLTSLIATIQNWMQRNGGKEVEIQIGTDKIRLKGFSDTELEQLVKQFLARHSAN